MLNRAIAPLFVFLWSTGFIGARLGLPYTDPLTYLVTRYGFVIVLMLAAATAFRAPWPTSRRAVLHIAVAGLLLQASYLGGVFMSIKLGLPTGLTALIVGLQPILTALLAGGLLGEAVSRRQWLGLGLGFGGLVLVVLGSRGVGQGWPWAALLPSIAALLGITAGTLYQKRFCPSFDLRSGAVIQFSASLLLTLPAALLTEPMHIAWTGEFMFALAWSVLMLSLGAISLLNILIRRGSAVHVSRLFYLTPGVTAVMGWLMFDERLALPAIAGLAIAAWGVWLSRGK